MIKLRNLLSEISQDELGAAAVGSESTEDISFPFKSQKIATKRGILSHEIISLDEFDTPDKQNVQFGKYHLIFGDSSMAIFDAFNVDETAGLTRQECKDFLDELSAEGKTERDNAYIAGLTNWAGDQAYCFFNVTRLSYPGYANRVLPHESLHLARILITLEANEFIRNNQGKGEWWNDPRAVFTQLEDDNEEYFAETLERCNAIAYNRWDKVRSIASALPKP